MKFSTKIHRDHTVTVWDVFTQQWVRLPALDAMSHKAWQGLSPRDRDRVEAAADRATA